MVMVSPAVNVAAATGAVIETVGLKTAPDVAVPMFDGAESPAALNAIT